MLPYNFSQKIVVRGGGDLATGVVQKFYRSGFPVVILEVPAPTAIRRSVALCEAVYDKTAQVEDVVCRKIDSPDGLEDCWRDGAVPLMVDETGDSIRIIRPAAVIDAILAKRNLGTNRGMAPITVALGPGFCAGRDVNAVIETMRGHNLGRLIVQGYAIPNTGIPGELGGKSSQRVLKAPVSGIVRHTRKIGDVVRSGDPLFTVGGTLVTAPFNGLLRGLIRENRDVPKGMKVADIDPRIDVDWNTISDKARCLGGAALEAYYYLANSKGRKGQIK
ncbi:MAG: selenium-dependent molybdenum cofactor biosynthesis protein YqeB [Peptococcaceae bacterium]|nr:selenium-dependent molybdenum cofactor biosynthesis protein YqeB [Peptococcaceae bacterium]